MATPGKSGSKLSKEIEISPYNLTEGMLAKLNISNVLSSIVQLNPQEAETAGTSNSSSADRSDSATEPGGASASAAQSGSHKLPLEAVDFVAMRKEVMILASFGDHFPEVDAVAKMKDNAERMNEECSPLNIELQLIQDMVNESETHSMKYVMVDFPGNQCTRDYYLKRIEHFFANCNKDAAMLWYTGAAERGTGNWCFKDGVITFQDVFELYLNHLSGKRLSLVCDCSYSGKWRDECVKKYDEIGVGACGHYSKEQGIMVGVFTSCKSDQEAYELWYPQDNMEVDEEKKRLIIWGKQLRSGQTPRSFSSTLVRCKNGREGPCQTDISWKWGDALLGHLVYLVRGKDRGKAAWHYVLVDEEKVEQFKEQVKMGTVDVADFGKVLHSGLGEDPPQNIRDDINKRFSAF